MQIVLLSNDPATDVFVPGEERGNGSFFSGTFLKLF